MKKDSKSYTVLHIYNSYVNDMGGNPIYEVDYNTYRSIVCDYLKWIVKEVLYKSSEIKLPSRVGSVLVVKKRPLKNSRKFYNVDFKSTNELGKTILHLNEHSDGFRYRFRWRREYVALKNKSLYEMVMSRTNKRTLAHIIKNKLNDFIEE